MARVYVGLSGGVDSAVAAALLLREGHDVTGAFIKIWQPEFIECSWRQDRLDAMRVCAALDIPYREVDLSAEYKRTVVDDMVEGYTRGITPNPDVLCNRTIKFGSFFEWAVKEGADFIATGHYVRNQDGKLFRGVDSNKDQSYFLYQIARRELDRALFPVGAYEKKRIRSLAREFELPVAEKPDSQGLCFAGDIELREFLSRFISFQKGDVLDGEKNVIGSHEGAGLYTIGQRHGFTVCAKKGASGPQYVVSIDTAKNTITVSPHRENGYTETARIERMHWIESEPPLPLSCLAQARYREAAFPVEVIKLGGSYSARARSPQLFSPGQSLVLYTGDECLGGGIIGA